MNKPWNEDLSRCNGASFNLALVMPSAWSQIHSVKMFRVRFWLSATRHVLLCSPSALPDNVATSFLSKQTTESVMSPNVKHTINAPPLLAFSNVLARQQALLELVYRIPVVF
jgi:hypothetical protein